MKKVCLISSSGGHFEQLLRLSRLDKDYSVYYVTERTPYSVDKKDTHYVKQINRKEKFLLINIFLLFVQSLKIFIKEKPDVIISTGALCVIPSFLIGKLFHKKLIFIESFAKIKTPTKTGRLIYKISDVFIVQWKSMLKYYPNAVYLGSIY